MSEDVKRGHYVRAGALRAVAISAVADAMGEAGYEMTERRIIANKVADRLGAYLEGLPAFPELISATGAARVLRIHAPHLSRLRDQGRLPEEVPVKGGNDVFVESEISALAKTLLKERAARRRRKSHGAR